MKSQLMLILLSLIWMIVVFPAFAGWNPFACMLIVGSLPYFGYMSTLL
jgi:hypothetical protein